MIECNRRKGTSGKPVLFSLAEDMSMKKDAPKEQKAFYHSAAWRKCRSEYIARVGGLCERCLEKGIVRPGRIVHHKEYISIQNITDPNVLLNPENLEYLCQNCHNAEHIGNNRRYFIDDNGRVVARD